MMTKISQKDSQKFKAIYFVVLIVFISIYFIRAIPSECKNNHYQPGIYSLSYKKQNSTVLGLSGVPAYVIAANKTYRGLYITNLQIGGQWSQLGLRPGDVLLSINNRVAINSQQLDQALSSTTSKSNRINLCYARNQNNIPIIVSKQVDFFPTNDIADQPPTNNSSHSSITSIQQNKEESISALEAYMLELVNQDRSRNGSVPAVSASAQLSELARNYAKYMLAHNYFSHTTPTGLGPQDRARQAGIQGGVAENISMISRSGNDRESVNFSQKQMMSEPPNQQNHRGTILDPSHCCVGIGIARNNRKLIIVQEFSRVYN
jgi:uncharacterized protein YkwD